MNVEWLLTGIAVFGFVIYESKTRKPIIPDLLYCNNIRIRFVWWFIIIWMFINFILLCIIG